MFNVLCEESSKGRSAYSDRAAAHHGDSTNIKQLPIIILIYILKFHVFTDGHFIDT